MEVNSAESSDSEMDETDDGMDEDDSSTDHIYKWTKLEHSGPAFAPPYKRLPNNVYFKYNRQIVSLSEQTEEMAVAYAKVLRRKYASEAVFKENFFNDWREIMTLAEQSTIHDIDMCDFTKINEHLSKMPKTRNKNQQDALKEKFGFCTIDEKETEIRNCNMEPPGLFRSETSSNRGKWKKRIQPEDVTINCSENCKPVAPQGHQWAAIVHDRSVSWLARWPNSIRRGWKYMRLSPSAELKGEEDRQKYDTAKALGTCIEDIRKKYREEWESEDTSIKQMAIAVYLIDTFAFRAGGDHDTDDSKTVGCCSLHVENITLHDPQEVEFDFYGKASIRYKNRQTIEHGAYEGLKSLVTGKEPNKSIFGHLTPDKVNEYLKKCMDNLTTKVFRTFRASSMQEAELRLKTESNMTKAEKLLVFRTANLKVAKLCNHRRTRSTIELEEKIFENHQEILRTSREIQAAEEGLMKRMKQSRVQHLTKQIQIFEQELSEKKENLLLGKDTSMEHYVDPRIVVAWCLKFGIPVSEIYSETLLQKFDWAIKENLANFIFYSTDCRRSSPLLSSPEPILPVTAAVEQEAGCSYSRENQPRVSQ